MEVLGQVRLDTDPIGTFTLDAEDRVVIAFNKGAADVKETLEMAAEHGLHFELMLTPEFPREE